jgi:putative ABC transport system permease protein
MNLAVIWRLFRATASRQRRRLILTISAIAWGTVSIVLLLSFGQGMRTALTAGQKGLGEGIAIIWPGQTQKPFGGFAPGRAIRPTSDDIELLRVGAPEIGAVAGEMRTWESQLVRGDVVINNRLTGADAIWGELRNQIPKPGGRFINPLDVAAKRRVIFLGGEVAGKLFGSEDPVGQQLLVDNTPFTVVGVLADKLQMGTYGGPDASNTVIPITTFEAIKGRRRLSNIVFRAASPELHEAAKDRFYELMSKRFRFDPSDRRALGMWDTRQSQATMANVGRGIELFLGIVGALTLIVGGVGVANIMFASVTQRTKEFGVLMALGAKRRFVTGPLVIESLGLTLFGGAIGIVVGAALVEGLAMVQRKANSPAMAFLGEPTFAWPAVLTTVALLGVVGWLAGLFPARRALAIEPAVVLREE